MKKSGIVATITLLLLLPESGWTRAIKLTAIQNIDFGRASPGDPAKLVAPGAQGASFLVQGDANRAYTITLPAAVTMTTGAGGANRTITVNAFTSAPVTGLLDGAGNQTLYVGATRAALLLSQVSGSYSGSMPVTVLY